MIDGFIAPRGLLDLVRNTVPWLETPATDDRPLAILADGPLGFRSVLAAVAKREPQAVGGGQDDATTLDYFTLCLAAHHATVASFVPTDVDSKIRGLLWRRVQTRQMLERMWAVTQRFCLWDVDAVSRRTVAVQGFGVHSGHDGERLSVLAGALASAMALGASDIAAQVELAIHTELEREANAFRAVLASKGAEIEALKLSAILVHNVGDLDQGLSFWPKTAAYQEQAQRFARLAHENTTPYRGVFTQAVQLYKATLAPEGHRNYPLRSVRALRQSYDFLLEMAPFLDTWGERIGADPRLRDVDLAEILEALVVGSRKLKGQRGYYRAIAGLMNTVSGRRLDGVVAKMPASVRTEFRGSEVRRQIAVPRASFESMLRKMVRPLAAA